MIDVSARETLARVPAAHVTYASAVTSMAEPTPSKFQRNRLGGDRIHVVVLYLTLEGVALTSPESRVL
jgi:hypothetical protein